MRTALFLVSLAALAACAVLEKSFGPDLVVNFDAQKVPGDTAVVNGDTVVFRRIAPGETPENLPPIIAEGLEGGVVVRGFFLAPVVGQSLQATVTRSGNDIELRISPVDVYGPDMPQPYVYEARLVAVPAGAYRVSVVHIADTLRDHTDKPLTVLDQEVQVR